MKRKIVQLQVAVGSLFYAVADDGTWWRLLGDPLDSAWSRMPDLPDSLEELERESPKPKRLAASAR